MANTGYTWGAWAFVANEDPADWNASALADNATEISGTANSLTGKAAAHISITLAEDNTGAIDGVVTVYILGDCSTQYEEVTIGTPWAITITPVQNDTVVKLIPVDPRDYENIKVAIVNTSGQELAVSVKIQTADIPLAS